MTKAGVTVNHVIVRSSVVANDNCRLPMAFLLLSQTLRRFLPGFYSLNDWIENALISPLSRLIHWPTFRHVEAVSQVPSAPFHRNTLLTSIQ
jgi:hypothetical protein